MARHYGRELSDAQLVEEARKAPPGDLRAFGELIRRYEVAVRTNCRYMSGNATDAEDLAQEVFVKAFFGMKTFEGRSTFSTWIRRIKANHCINYLKKQRPPVVSVEESGIRHPALRVEPDGVSRMTTATKRERIAQALEGISDSLRIPLVMRDMDGLSYQDISSELGIGLSAAKMRVQRGRREFRERYGKND